MLKLKEILLIIDRLYLEETRFWDLVLNLEAPDLTGRDYVLFEDQEWNHLATEWRKATEDLFLLESKEKAHRAALIAKAAGQGSKADLYPQVPFYRENG